MSHHWFQETFAHADESAAKEIDKNVYDILDANAAKLPPGSEKLFFIPHLGGRACPVNTNYRGVWLGMTWAHKREHFYRSIMESIAYDQYLTFQSLRAAYPESQITEITAYGGGSQSALWNQIKADVMGVAYVCLGREDLAAIGNAVLAGYALGIYDDMTETSERFVKRATRYEPRPEVHQYYRQCADFYETLLKQVEPAFANLATLPEWGQ